jgi:autotransporter-associated beta strand protein
MKQWVVLIFVQLTAVIINAQTNVYWQNANGVSIFWDDVNRPWFYPDNSTRNKPNVDYNFSTKHNVYFGNNTGNATISINGEFFGLRTFNIDNGATTPRTFQETFGGGIGIEAGIYNNSTTTHTFDVRIAIDQDGATLGADAGGLTFMKEIFSNGRPFILSGNQPLLVSGFISQSGFLTKAGTNTVTLTGANTFTGLTTVNNGTLRLNRTGGTTIPVTNNITVNGGNLQISTNQTINNLTFTSGTLTIDAGAVLTVTGTYTGGAGIIINNGRIVMAGAGAIQNFPGTATVITAMNELEINNPSGVNMNNSLIITSSLILTNGTLSIGAGNLLDLNGASLIRTSGYMNGSNTSDFTVRGTTGGNVIIPLNGANISLRTVTIGGTRTVAMNGINNIALSGAFTIDAAATFDNGGESQITQNTGGTIAINGTFITRDAQGFSGSNTAVPGIVPVLNSGCMVHYGRIGNQLVSIRDDYKNMRFSGGGAKTFAVASPITPVTGTVYIDDATILDVSNNTFGNDATSLSMSNGRFRTAGTGTTPNISGSFNLTGGVVEFYNTLGTTQTIRGGSSFMYHAVEVTGANVANSNSNINLRNNGSFTVKANGIFTMNDNAIVAGPSQTGAQTFTIETNAKFVCGDADGFSGTGNLTSIRSDDIETINLQTGSAIEYSRATAQVFSARSDYKNIIISGGGEKTLNGPAVMEGILTLTNGILKTSSTNMFTMSAGSSVANAVYATRTSGGSDVSFVNGPMKKVGNTDFIFPVGKPITTNPLAGKTVGGHHLIAISAPSNITDAFTAEYYIANANLIGPVVAPAAPQLVWVSACEYWRLDRTSGSSSVNVTLSWNSKSNCNVGYVTDLSELVVAHNTSATFTSTAYTTNTGSWNSYGRSSTTGDPLEGTITWNGVGTFSPFALGSTDANANPLPFNLSSFNATSAKNQILLNWSVGNNHEQQSYVLERSRDGIRFESIASVNAIVNLTLADYAYADNQPATGWNYYRLRAIDYQQKQSTSRIVRVWWGSGASVISVLPNPASEKIVINLSDPSSITEIQIVNSTGQVLRQMKSVQFSNEVIISSLQAGMYYIRLLGKNGLTTKSFIKQ